jgi:RecB family endonuclease NucS
MTLVQTNINQPHLNGGSRVSLRELANNRLIILHKDRSYIFHFDTRARIKNHLNYSTENGLFLSFTG